MQTAPLLYVDRKSSPASIQRTASGRFSYECHDRFGLVQREGTLHCSSSGHNSTALPDQIVHEAETTRSEDTGETTPTDLEAVGYLFDEVLTGEVIVEEACMSQDLTRIIERLDVKKQYIQASRTAKLWLQFMKMMDILRMFLKGERMGIWALQIQAMYEMMPYLDASGHNLYTKCIHVHLQQMHKLHETHPEVSRHFDQRQLYTLQCLEKLPWLAMTRICLCFCVFMSRKILVKSSSNQRSGPEQRRVQDAGTSSMRKVCWDVQFATTILLCYFLMPSSAVIQLLGYAAWEKDSP